MTTEEKTISMKDIEKAFKSVEKELYPKNCGNGLYQFAPGVFGNKRMLEEFNEIMKKEITNDNRR